ncbi:efflux RND transporter periplasmic adaptor subunit [Paraglaciecola sp. 2405UD69-4]|uniref:efflux RND transporter periplasmic adaptor subunit n=1 Tax=Paraglaciecola sp. 2405UD69-4 TaxID=3391836 RepID=UPI0039C93F20
MRFLTLLSFTLLVACSKAPVDDKPVIRPIAWTKVAQHDFTQMRRLPGVVEPVETASLSFLVNGKVEKVRVKLGEKVTAGQQLASLEQQNFALNYQSAEAQLAQAEATYTEAKNEFTRYSELVDKGLVSRSGFDTAKSKYESSQSARNVAKTQLDIARKNSEDSILLAPYAGVITKRMVEPSQQVSVGQAVFEIEGEDGLEVQVTVPETIIQQLTTGLILPVHFPALPNVNLQGVITEVGARAESANAFPVTLVLQDIPAELRAGMTAEVDVTFSGIGRTGYKGQTVQIPVSSILAGQGQQAYVFVYDPDLQVVNKRQVQTENILDNKVFVSDGLKVGEIIATAGVTFLREGQSVKLLEQNLQIFN